MKKNLIIFTVLLLIISIFVGCNEYNVDVNLDSIKVTVKPSSIQYLNSDIDITGMVVTAFYDKGFSGVINDFTVTPEKFETLGENTLTVSYKGKTALIPVTVVEDTLESISVKTLPDKMLYKSGEETLDLDGICVEGTYLSGKKEQITNFVSSPAEGTKIDTSNDCITLSVGSVSTRQKLYAYEDNSSSGVTFDHIEIVLEPTNAICYIDSEKNEQATFDISGMVVKGVYEDEKEAIITDYYVETPDLTKVNEIQELNVCFDNGDGQTLKDSFYFEIRDINRYMLKISRIASPWSRWDDFVPDITKITRVMFVKQSPTSFEEEHPALANTGNDLLQTPITGKKLVYGYVDGTTEYVVGEYILANPNSIEMFAEYTSLTELIGLENLDTSKVNVMQAMFGDCCTLRNLDLSSFDTSNVQYMKSMFYNCASLKALDVSSFDTSNVTDMAFMFYSCEDLISLDISSFDTSKVEYLNCMFACCSKLEFLNLGNLNTSSAIWMSNMFENCLSLKSIDLSSFDTSSVHSMAGMFYNCSSLTELDLINFKYSSIESLTYLDGLFSGCSKLETIYLGSFEIDGSSQDSLNLFGGNTALNYIYLDGQCEKLHSNLRTALDQGWHYEENFSEHWYTDIQPEPQQEHPIN